MNAHIRSASQSRLKPRRLVSVKPALHSAVHIFQEGQVFHRYQFRLMAVALAGFPAGRAIRPHLHLKTPASRSALINRVFGLFAAYGASNHKKSPLRATQSGDLGAGKGLVPPVSARFHRMNQRRDAGLVDLMGFLYTPS
jgi:hypothetical protein